MSTGVVDLFNQLAENDFGFFQRVKSVADVMTSDVKTLTLDDRFQDAVQLFTRNRFHHAPVIDPDGNEVVGILSDRDILRHRPRAIGTLAEGEGDHKALSTPLSQLMTREPFHVRADSSPVEALSLMLNNHIDCVLVYEDRQELQGIVTRRDFMKTLLLYHRVCTRTVDLKRLRLVDLDLSRGIPLDVMFSRGAQTVRDVMTHEITLIKTSHKVEDAIELMEAAQIRHLPVVDDEGQLIGMVSDRDVLHWLPSRKRGSAEDDQEQRSLFATDDKGALRGSVAAMMSQETTSVKPVALLVDVMATFQEQNVDGLPVVEAGSNRPCGIITTTDILRVFRVVMQIGSFADTAEADAARA